MVLSEITDQSDRNEVQHDRVDDFMRTKLCFENTGNRTPQPTNENRGQKTHRNEKPGRQIREGDTDPGGRKCCDVKLTFSSDVEETTAEPDEHCKTSKNQWSRMKQCVANAIWPRQSTSD